jgi:hypothetical protein
MADATAPEEKTFTALDILANEQEIIYEAAAVAEEGWGDEKYVILATWNYYFATLSHIWSAHISTYKVVPFDVCWKMFHKIYCGGFPSFFSLT